MADLAKEKKNRHDHGPVESTLSQPNLKTFMNRTTLWNDDSVEAQNVDRSIMDLILVDLHPYSIVSRSAFKRLNIGDPKAPFKYRLKSEKYFRTTLMPATFEKVETKVCDLLTCSKWISFTTDGASHSLQLIINDCFLKLENIIGLLKKCRKLVGHFKKSEQACRHLKKYQEMLSLPQHELVQDVPTRWNSVFLMLKRLLEQKSAIHMYSAERGSIEIPTTDGWEYIIKVIPVLQHFYDATLELCFDSANISMIIPLVTMLRIKLKPDIIDDVKMKNLKAALLNSLTNRFQHIYDAEFLVETFLDPRFKNKYFTTDQTEKCANIIRNQYE